jgi:hypothetical protein
MFPRGNRRGCQLRWHAAASILAIGTRGTQQRLAIFAGLDGQRVAGQGILFRQLDDLELEAAVFAFGAAFLEQHRHRNGKPVIAGAACVLARDLVEPSFAAPVSLK